MAFNPNNTYIKDPNSPGPEYIWKNPILLKILILPANGEHYLKQTNPKKELDSNQY